MDLMLGPDNDLECIYAYSLGESPRHFIKIRYLLALVYFHTGGPDWMRNVNFLSDAHHCNWDMGLLLCDEDNLFVSRLLLGTSHIFCWEVFLVQVIRTYHFPYPLVPRVSV